MARSHLSFIASSGSMPNFKVITGVKKKKHQTDKPTEGFVTCRSAMDTWKYSFILKALEQKHLSDEPVRLPGSSVYCRRIWNVDRFSCCLCCGLRQSRAVWPGRQEPPIALKCRMSHLEHSGKDFNTPPSPPPRPPLTSLTSPPHSSSLFLITHYPIPVLGREFHRYSPNVWKHVNLLPTGRIMLFNVSSLSIMKTRDT